VSNSFIKMFINPYSSCVKIKCELKEVNVNSEVKSRAGGKTEIEESNTAASIYSCVI